LLCRSRALGVPDAVELPREPVPPAEATAGARSVPPGRRERLRVRQGPDLRAPEPEGGRAAALRVALRPDAAGNPDAGPARLPPLVARATVAQHQEARAFVRAEHGPGLHRSAE